MKPQNKTQPLTVVKNFANSKTHVIFVALSLILLLRTSSAAAELLIDTGPGGTSTIGASSLFGTGETSCSPQPSCALAFQFLGGQFTLTAETELDSVQGWMALTNRGSIDVNIRADNNGLPGNVIFTKTYDLSNEPTGLTPSWLVFSEYSVVLSGGTFWLTFEPVAHTQFHASMPGGAPNPLLNYAFFANGNSNWVNFNLFGPNPGLGFRIAIQSAAPVAANIELTPKKGINVGGVSDTFTALVTTAEGVPVPNAVVTFQITHGPHEGLVSVVLTDANGQATFSYTQTVGPGTDHIKAVTGDIESKTVRQLWHGRRPN